MLKGPTYILLTASAVLLAAQTAGPKTFGTPEEACDALIQAAAGGLDLVRTLLGPESAQIVRSGDEVQDSIFLERFRQRAAEQTRLEPDQMNPERLTLVLGNEEWPFPIPLLRKNGQWYFDVREGQTEIRQRIIGGNELDAIQVCLGYVEAQQLYAQTDWSGKGVPQYAGRIVSTEGKQDGLYWPGEDSPVAASFAKAFAEGYPLPGGTRRPFHGYLYKILMAQGPAAVTGAQDYRIRGLMIGGFGLVAWPAEYRVSGIMTFIVNQDGVVYQKDLGPQTGALAEEMKEFNPDKSWTVPPQ